MQFQSEIELRVKVLDKELDQLEKRIARVANPFTASGAGRNTAAKQRRETLVAAQELNRAQLAAADKLENKRLKSFQVAVRRQNYLRKQRLDTEKAVADAQKKADREAAARLQRRNQRLTGAVQGAAISAAFPLLTGTGGAEAIFGGIGGALGGLAGGPLGSFAGGIAGSAIGKLVTDAENLNRELAALNARLGSTGTAAAVAASDISELASQLNITKEEAADLAGELVAVADATAIQDVAKAFGPVGGASTFEAIAQAGIDEKSALEAIDSLRGQIGIKAAEELTKVLEIEGATALQAALLDEVLRKSQDITTETAKQVTIWDRINFAVQEYLLGTAGASPQAIADDRAAGIEPPNAGILNNALTNFEDYLKKRDALLEKYDPKGGGSGTNEEERIQQRLASLQAETAAIQRRAVIESKISQARIAEDQSLVNRLTLERELSNIRGKEEKALARAKDLREKEAIATKASAEAAAARSRYTDKEAERLAQAEQSYTKQIETLGLQLEAAQAVTREEKQQAELQLRLLRLRNANKDLTEEQLQSLEAATKALFNATNLGPLEQYIKNTSAALADTEQQMTKVVQIVEGQLASGIANFFNGIVDGSKSAEEAFADMLKSMGQALVQTAAQMIAQYIAIGIARIFAGMGGGGGGGGASSVPSSAYGDMSVAGPSFFQGGMIPGYSTGGFIGADRVALVGENGPELIRSGPTGTSVTNNEDTKAAMERFSPSNQEAAAGGPMNPTINYNGPTLNFNGDDYIPRSEAGSLVAAGAKQGETRAINRLRNSRMTRSKIGI